MTEKEKSDLKVVLQQISDTLFTQICNAVEMAEQSIPAECTEEQKHELITMTVSAVFKAQEDVIRKGFTEVQSKLSDKEYIKKAMEELYGR
jgi:hypothetical protein